MVSDLSSASETPTNRLRAFETAKSAARITGEANDCTVVVEGQTRNNNNYCSNWNRGATINRCFCRPTTNKLHPHFGLLLISYNNEQGPEETTRVAGDNTSSGANGHSQEREDKFINFTATASGPELLLSTATAAIISAVGEKKCDNLSRINKTKRFSESTSAAVSYSVACADHLTLHHWISSHRAIGL